MLGTSQEIKWKKTASGLKITLPNLAKLQHLKYAWTLKMTNLLNRNSHNNNINNHQTENEVFPDALGKGIF